MQRVPPLTANLGQACYKCYKDEGAALILQKCAKCRRVSYCSAGVFFESYNAVCGQADQYSKECQKVSYSRLAGMWKQYLAYFPGRLDATQSLLQSSAPD